MKLFALTFAIAVLARTASRAEPPGLTAPVPPATETSWYGWQLLLADGATLGLAAASNQGELAFGWIGTGAAVHVAHHHPGRAAASVSMRVLFPLLGVAIASANVDHNSDHDIGEIVLGGMVGMGGAELVDLLMSTDEREIAPRTPASGWTPVATVRRSGATFGITARF